jgi:hypothetical protein
MAENAGGSGLAVWRGPFEQAETAARFTAADIIRRLESIVQLTTPFTVSQTPQDNRLNITSQTFIPLSDIILCLRDTGWQVDVIAKSEPTLDVLCVVRPRDARDVSRRNNDRDGSTMSQDTLDLMPRCWVDVLANFYASNMSEVCLEFSAARDQVVITFNSGLTHVKYTAWIVAAMDSDMLQSAVLTLIDTNDPAMSRTKPKLILKLTHQASIDVAAEMSSKEFKQRAAKRETDGADKKL